ncbi:GTPase RsgA [Gordoniibacillus kamchatkensis]|uniref:Small ribosomal subunit biogenesis GTPase RsgA n=1 Tax=Gordoniibacillus kamchatkensis TaxID=1590651 RepID=A0ABR5AJK9_9BACL|nr:ribosome small subunit-dependent GTPase A [Paenibacillus sp. VKM B-2647]KIL41135.1 GTPase RsgA [Paenibacillus sp. VKM B-2647]
MPKGLIVKALSGFYYVLEDGQEAAGEQPVQCRARGIFKKKGITPLVGDRVSFERTGNGEGTVDEIAPRTTELIRPPIANMELALLAFSVVEPDLNVQLLDKFLVHIEHAGLTPVICLTKRDLLKEADDDVLAAEVEQAAALYRSIGYEVLITSSKWREGIEQVAARIAGGLTVIAGQSGVGKSSLLNALIPGLELETNAISHKLGRGKHTTRHVELLPLPAGGWVADTPGFSQLDFAEIEAESLGACFREFGELAERCKFRGCLHVHEPDCRVREAAGTGDIAESRYEHYVQFLQMIRERPRRY